MKVVEDKENIEARIAAIKLVEYYNDRYYYDRKRKKQIKSPNDLTDDVIKFLVQDCCENSKLRITTLAEYLRLANKLTDDNIELLIKNCLAWYISKLAKQIKLAGKLTNKYIELLIEHCSYTDIPELLKQIPDDYKPSKAVIMFLDEKGYKVLD